MQFGQSDKKSSKAFNGFCIYKVSQNNDLRSFSKEIGVFITFIPKVLEILTSFRIWPLHTCRMLSINSFGIDFKVPSNTVADLKYTSKLESNEKEKLTSPRKTLRFSDSALSLWSFGGNSNFPQNLKQSVILNDASLLFVTRSFCFITNNLYQLSISSAMFTFRIVVKPHILYTWFVFCNVFSEIPEVSNAIACPSLLQTVGKNSETKHLQSHGVLW